MISRRTAAAFVVLLVAFVATLFLHIPTASAMGEFANGMCKPWYKDCGCGMEPNPEHEKDASKPACIKGKNTNKCKVGVCYEDPAGVGEVRGICVAAGKCEAVECDGGTCTQAKPGGTGTTPGTAPSGSGSETTPSTGAGAGGQTPTPNLPSGGGGGGSGGGGSTPKPNETPKPDDEEQAGSLWQRAVKENTTPKETPEQKNFLDQVSSFFSPDSPKDAAPESKATEQDPDHQFLQTQTFGGADQSQTNVTEPVPEEKSFWQRTKDYWSEEYDKSFFKSAVVEPVKDFFKQDVPEFADGTAEYFKELAREDGAVVPDTPTELENRELYPQPTHEVTPTEEELRAGGGDQLESDVPSEAENRAQFADREDLVPTEAENREAFPPEERVLPKTEEEIRREAALENREPELYRAKEEALAQKQQILEEANRETAIKQAEANLKAQYAERARADLDAAAKAAGGELKGNTYVYPKTATPEQIADLDEAIATEKELAGEARDANARLGAAVAEGQLAYKEVQSAQLDLLNAPASDRIHDALEQQKLEAGVEQKMAEIAGDSTRARAAQTAVERLEGAQKYFATGKNADLVADALLTKESERTGEQKATLDAYNKWAAANTELARTNELIAQDERRLSELRAGEQTPAVARQIATLEQALDATRNNAANMLDRMQRTENLMSQYAPGAERSADAERLAKNLNGEGGVVHDVAQGISDFMHAGSQDAWDRSKYGSGIATWAVGSLATGIYDAGLNLAGKVPGLEGLQTNNRLFEYMTSNAVDNAAHTFNDALAIATLPNSLTNKGFAILAEGANAARGFEGVVAARAASEAAITEYQAASNALRSEIRAAEAAGASATDVEGLNAQLATLERSTPQSVIDAANLESAAATVRSANEVSATGKAIENYETQMAALQKETQELTAAGATETQKELLAAKYEALQKNTPGEIRQAAEDVRYFRDEVAKAQSELDALKANGGSQAEIARLEAQVNTGKQYIQETIDSTTTGLPKSSATAAEAEAARTATTEEKVAAMQEYIKQQEAFNAAARRTIEERLGENIATGQSKPIQDLRTPPELTAAERRLAELGLEDLPVNKANPNQRFLDTETGQVYTMEKNPAGTPRTPNERNIATAEQLPAEAQANAKAAIREYEAFQASKSDLQRTAVGDQLAELSARERGLEGKLKDNGLIKTGEGDTVRPMTEAERAEWQAQRAADAARDTRMKEAIQDARTRAREYIDAAEARDNSWARTISDQWKIAKVDARLAWDSTFGKQAWSDWASGVKDTFTSSKGFSEALSNSFQVVGYGTTAFTNVAPELTQMLKAPTTVVSQTVGATAVESSVARISSPTWTISEVAAGERAAIEAATFRAAESGAAPYANVPTTNAFTGTAPIAAAIAAPIAAVAAPVEAAPGTVSIAPDGSESFSPAPVAAAPGTVVPADPVNAALAGPSAVAPAGPSTVAPAPSTAVPTNVAPVTPAAPTVSPAAPTNAVPASPSVAPQGTIPFAAQVLAGPQLQKPLEILARVANRLSDAPQPSTNPIPEWMREALSRSVTPIGYAGGDVNPGGQTERQLQNRQDAWRTYLNLDQQNNTFAKSDFSPAKSTNPGQQYYKIINFLPDFVQYAKSGGQSPTFKVQLKGGPDFSESDAIRYLADVAEQLKAPTKTGGMLDDVPNALPTLEDRSSFVMGHYTLAKGEDANGPYISYYDNWKLDRETLKIGPLKYNLEGRNGLVGKPFELYDRIYYDPVTFAPRTNVRADLTAPTDVAMLATGDVGVGAPEFAPQGTSAVPGPQPSLPSLSDWATKTLANLPNSLNPISDAQAGVSISTGPLKMGIQAQHVGDSLEGVQKALQGFENLVNNVPKAPDFSKMDFLDAAAARLEYANTIKKYGSDAVGSEDGKAIAGALSDFDKMVTAFDAVSKNNAVSDGLRTRAGKIATDAAKFKTDLPKLMLRPGDAPQAVTEGKRIVSDVQKALADLKAETSAIGQKLAEGTFPASGPVAVKPAPATVPVEGTKPVTAVVTNPTFAASLDAIRNLPVTFGMSAGARTNLTYPTQFRAFQDEVTVNYNLARTGLSAADRAALEQAAARLRAGISDVDKARTANGPGGVQNAIENALKPALNAYVNIASKANVPIDPASIPTPAEASAIKKYVDATNGDFADKFSRNDFRNDPNRPAAKALQEAFDSLRKSGLNAYTRFGLQGESLIDVYRASDGSIVSSFVADKGTPVQTGAFKQVPTSPGVVKKNAFGNPQYYIDATDAPSAPSVATVPRAATDAKPPITAEQIVEALKPKPVAVQTPTDESTNPIRTRCGAGTRCLGGVVSTKEIPPTVPAAKPIVEAAPTAAPAAPAAPAAAPAAPAPAAPAAAPATPASVIATPGQVARVGLNKLNAADAAANKLINGTGPLTPGHLKRLDNGTKEILEAAKSLNTPEAQALKAQLNKALADARASGVEDTMDISGFRGFLRGELDKVSNPARELAKLVIAANPSAAPTAARPTVAQTLGTQPVVPKISSTIAPGKQAGIISNITNPDTATVVYGFYGIGGAIDTTGLSYAQQFLAAKTNGVLIIPDIGTAPGRMGGGTAGALGTADGAKAFDAEMTAAISSATGISADKVAAMKRAVVFHSGGFSPSNAMLLGLGSKVSAVQSLDGMYPGAPEVLLSWMKSNPNATLTALCSSTCESTMKLSNALSNAGITVNNNVNAISKGVTIGRAGAGHSALVAFNNPVQNFLGATASRAEGTVLAAAGKVAPTVTLAAIPPTAPAALAKAIAGFKPVTDSAVASAAQPRINIKLGGNTLASYIAEREMSQDTVERIALEQAWLAKRVANNMLPPDAGLGHYIAKQSNAAAVPAAVSAAEAAQAIKQKLDADFGCTGQACLNKYYRYGKNSNLPPEYAELLRSKMALGNQSNPDGSASAAIIKAFVLAVLVDPAGFKGIYINSAERNISGVGSNRHNSSGEFAGTRAFDLQGFRDQAQKTRFLSLMTYALQLDGIEPNIGLGGETTHIDSYGRGISGSGGRTWCYSGCVGVEGDLARLRDMIGAGQKIPDDFLQRVSGDSTVTPAKTYDIYKDGVLVKRGVSLPDNVLQLSGPQSLAANLNAHPELSKLLGAGEKFVVSNDKILIQKTDGSVTQALSSLGRDYLGEALRSKGLPFTKDGRGGYTVDGVGTNLRMVKPILSNAVFGLGNKLDAATAAQLPARIAEAQGKFRFTKDTDKALVFGILAQETRGLTNERSPANAYGIGQTTMVAARDLFESGTPSWIRDYFVKTYGSPERLMSRIVAGDVQASVDATVGELSNLRYRYGLNDTGVIAAYNGGPTRGRNYVNGSGFVPAETADYVPKVQRWASHVTNGQIPGNQTSSSAWAAVMHSMRNGGMTTAPALTGGGGGSGGSGGGGGGGSGGDGGGKELLPGNVGGPGGQPFDPSAQYAIVDTNGKVLAYVVGGTIGSAGLLILSTGPDGEPDGKIQETVSDKASGDVREVVLAEKPDGTPIVDSNGKVAAMDPKEIPKGTWDPEKKTYTIDTNPPAPSVRDPWMPGGHADPYGRGRYVGDGFGRQFAGGAPTGGRNSGGGSSTGGSAPTGGTNARTNPPRQTPSYPAPIPTPLPVPPVTPALTAELSCSPEQAVIGIETKIQIRWSCVTGTAQAQGFSTGGRAIGTTEAVIPRNATSSASFRVRCVLNQNSGDVVQCTIPLVPNTDESKDIEPPATSTQERSDQPAGRSQEISETPETTTNIEYNPPAESEESVAEPLPEQPQRQLEIPLPNANTEDEPQPNQVSPQPNQPTAVQRLGAMFTSLKNGLLSLLSGLTPKK